MNNFKNRYNSVFVAVVIVLIINAFMLGVLINSNMMYRNINFGNDNNINQIVNVNNELKYPEDNLPKININTASITVLKTLEGIGEIKAKNILDYRPFQTIYDIRNVVGEKTFEKIKKNIEI